MIWLAWLRVAPLPGCRVVQEAFDPRLEMVIAAENRAALASALAEALARHRYGVLEIEAAAPWAPDVCTHSTLRAAAERARLGQPTVVSLGMPPTSAATSD